jgi:hypothetical protein
MSGGTKPRLHSRKAEGFKDGQKKGGGVNAARHAGPGRASMPRTRSAKGGQP